MKYFRAVKTKAIYDALRDLVAFIQFKKREKDPGRSVNSMEIDHEITLKILEFVLNWIEKVKLVFFLSSKCIFSELNETKSCSHSFHLQNSGILQTIMGQRGDPMNINFENF